jgi:regulatory protein
MRQQPRRPGNPPRPAEAGGADGGRSAKDKALDLLGYRARSREELFRRLVLAGYEDADVVAALDDLEAVGLVDDEAFARQLAGHEIRRRGSGRRVALMALRRAGVDREIAERVVEEAAPDDDAARAEELARIRVERLRGLDDATAYRRLLSYLLRRGYEGEVARTAARGALRGSSRE